MLLDTCVGVDDAELYLDSDDGVEGTGDRGGDTDGEYVVVEVGVYMGVYVIGVSLLFFFLWA
jgi:hypothetical protein